MKSDFDEVMDLIFQSEGGYAERDSEPGGAVNLGISFNMFKDWWAHEKKPGAPTWADLKALTRTDAEATFASHYFDPIRFGQLPKGVDYALVDFAVNSGVGGACRAVQREMHFTVTPGGIDTNDPADAKWFWALRNRPAQEIINDIMEARLTLMMGSSKWPRFKGNWSRRLLRVGTKCYALAGITAPFTMEGLEP